MLYIKKIGYLIALGAILLLFTASKPAENSFYYTYEAQKLNDMGLYDGISASRFEPDLGSAVERDYWKTANLKKHRE